MRKPCAPQGRSRCATPTGGAGECPDLEHPQVELAELQSAIHRLENVLRRPVTVPCEQGIEELSGKRQVRIALPEERRGDRNGPGQGAHAAVQRRRRFRCLGWRQLLLHHVPQGPRFWPMISSKGLTSDVFLNLKTFESQTHRRSETFNSYFFDICRLLTD